MSTASTVRISRSDRVGLVVMIVLGAAAALWSIYSAASRIIEVVTASEIPVLAPFIGEHAHLPLGPGGASTTVEVEEAVIFASNPAPATLFALIAAPVVSVIATLIVITCIALFCRNLLEGVAFSRTNTRLVITASVTIALGWFVSSLFTTMGVNGAFAALSNHEYDNVIFATDFTPVIMALALSAVGLAFQAGERMQRDTEGLV
jgi:hypothetical protein